MKIPPKDFEIFKKECLRLQKEWGLSGWHIYFAFKPLGDRLAQTKAMLLGRKAEMTLSSEIPDDVYGVDNPLLSAKHEMLHLLLWRLSANAYSRFINKEELEEAEEETVIRLTQIIK